MILRGWRSAARGFFAAGSTEEAIRACFRFSGESGASCGDRIEAKVVGVDFRKFQKRQRLAQMNFLRGAWRSAVRGFFAADSTEDATFEHRAFVRLSGESDAYWGERIEAEAAEMGELRSYSISPVKNHQPLEDALVKREESVKLRRAKESAELEAAIQAINRGTWQDGRGWTAPAGSPR